MGSRHVLISFSPLNRPKRFALFVGVTALRSVQAGLPTAGHVLALIDDDQRAESLGFDGIVRRHSLAAA